MASVFDVAAAGVELARDEIDVGGGEERRGAGALDDGDGDFLGIEHGDGTGAAAHDGPTGEGENGLHGRRVAEEFLEKIFQPLGATLRLGEAVAVFAPRVGEDLAVVDDFVGGEAVARAAFAASFGFDGEDAGGSDDDVIDVEGLGFVAGGDVVKDAAALGFQRLKGFGDDAFAEIAEVAIVTCDEVADEETRAEIKAAEQAEDRSDEADELPRAGEARGDEEQQVGGEERQDERGEEISDLLFGFGGEDATLRFAGTTEEFELIRKGSAFVALTAAPEKDAAEKEHEEDDVEGDDEERVGH